MKKLTLILLVISALMLSVSCSDDSDSGTNSGASDPWVGEWLSAGTDVAPLLVAVFNYDSVRVTMTDEGTVTTESHIIGGGGTIITGTYSVTKAPTGTVHSIHLIYAAFEQEGIIEVTDGTPATMKLEAVQTVPDYGFVPRTPETGFGSDATVGTSNIQNYKKVN